MFGADPEVFIMKNSESLVETEHGQLPKLVPPQSLIQDFGVEPELIDDKVVLTKGQDISGQKMERQLNYK